MRKNKSYKKNKKPLMTINYNNGCFEDLYDKNSLMYLLMWSGDISVICNTSLTVVQNKGVYTNNYILCNICKEYNN